jgi:hypothetical protein
MVIDDRIVVNHGIQERLMEFREFRACDKRLSRRVRAALQGQRKGIQFNIGL